MYHKLLFLFLFLILIFASCTRIEKKTELKDEIRLVKIDYSDPHYADLKDADTITPGKWKIAYYYLPDSTRYHDLYVSCSRDSVYAVYCCQDLILKNEVLPHFQRETADAIYFSFGDTANGPDLLAFSKKSNDKFREYRNVIKADYEKGLVVYLSQRCFQEGKPYELMLGDIPNMKRHRIPYDYYCASANKASAIDSIIFKAGEVSIMTTLVGDKKKYKQTRVIKR